MGGGVFYQVVHAQGAGGDELLAAGGHGGVQRALHLGLGSALILESNISAAALVAIGIGHGGGAQALDEVLDDGGILVMGSYFLALLLRFDFTFSAIEVRFIDGFVKLIGPWCAVTLVVFYFCHLYHSIWSLASTTELISILKAYMILLPLYYILRGVMDIFMPRSYFVMGYILNFCLTTGLRFSYRVFRVQLVGFRRGNKREDRIMIIGAGAAGQMLIKEMQNNPGKIKGKVLCAIDDNPDKKGRFIEGIEIVGNRHDIVRSVQKYHITTIIYAIPSTDAKDRTAILNICPLYFASSSPLISDL